KRENQRDHRLGNFQIAVEESAQAEEGPRGKNSDRELIAEPYGGASMNRILVIGGTGNVGRHVVCQLAATGVRFRALTRNPGAAGLPPQAEVVRGDLTVPETLDRCLQDIDTVFLVWVAPAAAVAGAVERIAK